MRNWKTWIAAAVLTMAAAQTQAAIIFDNITGTASFSATSGLPRSVMGQSVTPSLTPLVAETGYSGGSIYIKSISSRVRCFTATTYTNVTLRISIWNASTDATTGSGTVFSSLLGSYSFNFGARTFVENGTLTGTGNLTTPLEVPDPSKLAFTITWAGATDGGTAVPTDNLTSSLVSVAPAVGTTPANFYRNASGALNSDYGFLGSDSRTISGNTFSNLALRVVAVPETTNAALIAPAALLLVRRRKA